MWVMTVMLPLPLLLTVMMGCCKGEKHVWVLIRSGSVVGTTALELKLPCDFHVMTLLSNSGKVSSPPWETQGGWVNRLSNATMVTPAVMYEADLMHLHKTKPTTSTVQPVTAHSRRAEEKQHRVPIRHLPLWEWMRITSWHVRTMTYTAETPGLTRNIGICETTGWKGNKAKAPTSANGSQSKFWAFSCLLCIHDEVYLHG